VGQENAFDEIRDSLFASLGGDGGAGIQH